MIRFPRAVVHSVGASLALALASPVLAEASLDDEASQASYELGYSITANMSEQLGDGVDAQAFLAGAEDALNGAEKKLNEDQVANAYQVLNRMRAEIAEARLAANAAAGENFLVENAKRDGVTSLPSGLQYEVLTAAEGPKPKLSDRVTTHYIGRLVDGTVFDSSVARGQPATFPLNGVIKGWTEALQLMSVGEKWRLFIPPELGYGARGAGSDIPPNATLVFEVELLNIED